MLPKEFNDFFTPYSQNVDTADELYFWRLSDEIIYNIIRKYIPTSLSKRAVILDAGGGTGRWLIKLSSNFQCNFLLYDLSEDMLKKARENISHAGISERVAVMHGDLGHMDNVVSNSVDNAISIYSPLSFVQDPLTVVKELYRVMKPGGRLLIMGHGFYNALFSKITNSLSDSAELEELDASMMVKWAPHVPKLHLFSRERMEDLLTSAGFKIITTYGVPVFVQPSQEDFDPTNVKKSSISQALETRPDFFKKVLEIELKYSNLASIVNRGVNIFSVAEK